MAYLPGAQRQGRSRVGGGGGTAVRPPAGPPDIQNVLTQQRAALGRKPPQIGGIAADPATASRMGKPAISGGPGGPIAMPPTNESPPWAAIPKPPMNETPPYAPEPGYPAQPGQPGMPGDPNKPDLTGGAMDEKKRRMRRIENVAGGKGGNMAPSPVTRSHIGVGVRPPQPGGVERLFPDGAPPSTPLTATIGPDGQPVIGHGGVDVSAQVGGPDQFTTMSAGGPGDLTTATADYGPPSGPIMASPTMQGRGGGTQQMGGGRFGGAPPPQVLARRRALQQRMRQAFPGGGLSTTPWTPQQAQQAQNMTPEQLQEFMGPL